jgi:hypothetical protein
MNPAYATTLMIVSIVAATASTATLTAGIVVGVKVRRKLIDLEEKYENAKEATRKFARSMADI